MKLHVNVDHVATLRQARGTTYPSPLEAAGLAVKGGADGITVHLREDRRHINDADLFSIKDAIQAPLNMEMAATDEMIGIALKAKPHTSTLVPEKRQEQTTERGLFIYGDEDLVTASKIKTLKDAGLRVSLFVDCDETVLRKSAELGADRVELHTGPYTLAEGAELDKELDKIAWAVSFASSLGLGVAVGHGLDYENVKAVAGIEGIEEFSIGHSIVSRAVIVGMEQAVRDMRNAISQ